MSETSASLLERLSDRADADAWRRLVDLYTPLIRDWLRCHGVPPSDATFQTCQLRVRLDAK